MTTFIAGEEDTTTYEYPDDDEYYEDYNFDDETYISDLIAASSELSEISYNSVDQEFVKPAAEHMEKNISHESNDSKISNKSQELYESKTKSGETVMDEAEKDTIEISVNDDSIKVKEKENEVKASKQDAVDVENAADQPKPTNEIPLQSDVLPSYEPVNTKVQKQH